MSYDDRKREQPRQRQSSAAIFGNRPTASPGKRTLTMGIPARLAIQRQALAGAEGDAHEVESDDAMVEEGARALEQIAAMGEDGLPEPVKARLQELRQQGDAAPGPELAEDTAVQRQGEGRTDDAATVHAAASRGVAGSAQELPYRDRIQQSFGRHDVSGIEAHMGGSARDAAADIGAEAYALGTHVAFRAQPSLHTAAHEAAHVVQQRAGVSLEGGVGEAGDAYERHADAVADRVVAGESAETLLDQMAPGPMLEPVQRLAIQRQGGNLPTPPFGDADLQQLSKEQLDELYRKYKKSHPQEANKVKRMQKQLGFRGSSVKRTKGKKFLKKAAGKAGRAVKVLAPIFFLYDWSQGGFGHAVDEALWPVSELWN